jgi:hypothetical protein
LTLGHGITIGHQAVELLMRRAEIQGISGRPRFRRLPSGAATPSIAAIRTSSGSRTSLSIRPERSRSIVLSSSMLGRGE